MHKMEGCSELAKEPVLPARGGSAFGGKTGASIVSMPCIYVLFSDKSGKFYIGSSRSDTAYSRLKNHNSGKVRSTKSGRPWKLIYTEIFDTYTKARKREIFLKSGKGREWLYDKFSNLRRGAPNWLRNRS